MSKRDFYEILGVSKTSTPDEIKAAYRKLAMKYHPDRNPDNKEAEEKFKEASAAYEILSDQQKRKKYDQFGHAGMSDMGANNMNMEDIFESFGDIFGSMFGGAAGTRAHKRQGPEPKNGHTLIKEIDITLKESFLGTSKEIQYYHFIACATCDNTGSKAGTKAESCKNCQGTGQVQFRQGFFMYAQTCGSCNGEGFIIASPCPTCAGKSRIQQYESFSVNIPAGIYEGAELRLASKGDAGVFKGKSGDLILKVHVLSDKKFSRLNDDLHCTLMLSYPQLVLGSQVEIESIDGTKHLVKISKGTPVDEKVIIVGKGFPKIKSKVSGNLVVKVQCHIPKKLSSTAKEKLIEYSELIGTSTDNDESTIISFFKKFLG